MKTTVYLSLVFCLLFAGAVFADGELDLTFGVRGKVITDFFHGNDEVGKDVVRQSDGKLVVAGSFCRQSGKCDFALARYRVNGALDTNFGKNGKVVTDFHGRDDIASAVAVDQNARIVVVGTSYAPNGSSDVAIARYLPAGSLDPSFGDQGMLLTNLNDYDVALDVKLQATSIVVCGSTDPTIRGIDAFVMRYGPTGVLDSTFGQDGITLIDAQSYDRASAITFGNSGIFVAGTSTPNSGYNGRFSWDFFVARTTLNGKLDSTFGGGAGFVLTDFHEDSDEAMAVRVRQDGRVAVAGSVNTYVGPTAFGLVLYKPDGSLDRTFGKNGKLEMFAGSVEAAADLLIDSSGRFLVSGNILAWKHSGAYQAAITRVLPNGTLDPTFGTQGKKTIMISGGDFHGGAMVFQKDKLVLAGIFEKKHDDMYLDSDFLLLRLLLN